jgi:hypothetical protein
VKRRKKESRLADITGNDNFWKMVSVCVCHVTISRATFAEVNRATGEKGGGSWVKDLVTHV